jgi:hypothetical protein
MASDSSDRTRQYRDALYEALAGFVPATRDADPLLLLSRLSERAALKTHPAIYAELGEVASISKANSLEAAIAAAEAHFETPARFRDAIYFARCLDRDAADATALLDARRYLEAAVIPASAITDLSTDRDAVLDATTFATLWHDPIRLHWMLELANIWRRTYIGAYAREHAAFNAALAEVVDLIDAAGPAAVALERLNSLRNLGPAVARVAIDQFHEMEHLFACHVEPQILLVGLEQSPVCAECGYKLGDEVPAVDARRVRTAVERGLASQQTRLSQRVIFRLLARPAGEDRLQRFIDVVQASDLAGLALVLDEGLLEFLRDLLAAADDAPGLFDRLTNAYPEVTSANLDSAVAEFRRLLEEGLTTSGRLRLRGDSEA